MYSLLSFNDMEIVSILQKKEKSFSEEDFSAQTSEGVILKLVIIRFGLHNYYSVASK